MNLIVCCAVYKGDSVTERGLKNHVLSKFHGTGKKPLAIPISLLPSFAAGETTAPSVFAEGTNILINGRTISSTGWFHVCCPYTTSNWGK